MKQNYLRVLILLFAFVCIHLVGSAKKKALNLPYSGNVIVNNLTGEQISILEYWVGKQEESDNPGMQWKSKGSIEKDDHNFSFDETFSNKKANTLVLKATLNGGGYIKTKYSLSKNQKSANIKLFNKASEIPTDDYKTVIEKFKQYNFDNDYLKMNDEDAVLSVLGSLYLVDKTEQNVLYTVTAKELKSNMPRVCKQNNTDQAQGIFSSNTVIQGGINLPFVSGKSDFTTCDVCKYSWSIDNVGVCTWTPPGDKDLATLFSELTKATKDVLLRTYIDNPGSKLKFINKIFVIGRIDIETIKSKHIDNANEITGSSFVTAKGNFSLVNDYSTKQNYNDIVTKADGYYATGLLANEYLLQSAAETAKGKEQDNARIKSEFTYLQNKYPKVLQSTDDVDLMKKQILDLNKQVGGINYINTPEGSSETKLNLFTQPNNPTSNKIQIQSNN